MPVQDRTNEFRQCVESIRSRSSYPARSGAKDRLLQPANGNGKLKGGAKSEFSRMAMAVGKDISSTTLKLQKLAQREDPQIIFIHYLWILVAKRKTLFDDRPVEISVCIPAPESTMG